MITVAVPTRHRLPKLHKFIKSLIETTSAELRPNLLIISDAPEDNDPTIKFAQQLSFEGIGCDYIRNRYKSGLAQLWNQCIYAAPTDWVLVCNDDGVFQNGWLEWLLKQIGSGQFLQVNIMHYGGFCINKRMILRNGWFDERFMGGGFEDNDWQLRIYEGGLGGIVRPWSSDWTFMHHEKTNDGNNWADGNVFHWMMEKWGKIDHWHLPAFRRHPEIDWHPYFTALYSRMFGEPNCIGSINKLVGAQKEAFHG